MRSTSHLAPVNRANNPRTISKIVPLIDFFEFALMVDSSLRLIRVSNRIPDGSGRNAVIANNRLAVHLFLITLKADAGHAQADHGEGGEHLPVRGDRCVFPCSYDSKGQL